MLMALPTYLPTYHTIPYIYTSAHPTLFIPLHSTSPQHNTTHHPPLSFLFLFPPRYPRPHTTPVESPRSPRSPREFHAKLVYQLSAELNANVPQAFQNIAAGVPRSGRQNFGAMIWLARGP
ncbi:hypothetical protein P280DRAFT_333386 [Massarina eburnea CBS 473.64]|uniref:Uncharacterized protein n=1 Tax=Massarina eburnea CBS 473.64 TaxID=1395130 RepID=A0A6A6S431_9PLEO|nr:hypothetical protein P280DRAFT_333386 [Massarina eburnea CBS 473.64]